MAGIDNILSLIKQDADEKAGEIISAAKAEAEKLIKAAGQEADAKAAEIAKQGEIKSADAVSRARSSAELEKRKLMLVTRQEIISSVIAEAKESLESLDDDAYFENLYRLIKKYSLDTEGTIALGAKDLARAPADFEAKANAAAAGKLTLSKEPENIKNGFLLIYGGIDINCSFDALFDDSMEKLQDTVSGIVFA